MLRFLFLPVSLSLPPSPPSPLSPLSPTPFFSVSLSLSLPPSPSSPPSPSLPLLSSLFLFSFLQAVDHRGITPLLAAYKCGHVEVVEWLLAHVAHLPSDAECHKAFVAPMPQDTDLLPRRTKCLELIMKVQVLTTCTCICACNLLHNLTKGSISVKFFSSCHHTKAIRALGFSLGL